MEMCVSTTAVLLYYAKTVLKYFKNHIIKWLWLHAGPEINANIRVAQMVPPIECDLGYRIRTLNLTVTLSLTLK